MQAQQADTLAVDGVDVLSDSLLTAMDSTISALNTSDSINADSASMAKKQGSAIESEVKYNASDSLIFSLDGGKVELYGDAIITFEDIELQADYIRYEMDQSLVVAFGLPDSAVTYRAGRYLLTKVAPLSRIA